MPFTEFLPGPEMISKIQSDPSPLGYNVFSNGLRKKCYFRLCSKIIVHCHLQNFPPVPEMISKIQSDPSPLGYNVFSIWLYVILFFKWFQKVWVYVDKYLNNAIFFKFSPWFQRCYRKFNPTLFHWNTSKVLFCVLWSSKWSPYICIIWTLTL